MNTKLSLIESGGGTGPLKPRQPTLGYGANSCRPSLTDKRGECASTSLILSNKRGFLY